ncbi:MAG TPA: fibronectin type III domain-containing protein [Candidatus Angelobacter sp.]|nr:fibronectin type III domain-containing protein [Candidatus Angelobacter sp.]
MKKYLATLIVGVALAGWGMAQNGSVQITQPPKVENVTSNSAIIAWSTNVNSSTLVHYGTDQNSLTKTAEMPWGGLTHRVTLKNLQPGTTYYYQAVSDKGQGTGTKADAPVSSFQTSGGPLASNSAPASPAAPAPATAAPAAATGQTPALSAANTPFQAGPVPEKVEDTTARIWFLPPAAGQYSIKYGTSEQALTQTAVANAEPSPEVGNEAQITGLQPSTGYFYQVTDASGKPIDGGQFTTLPTNFRQGGTVWITNGPVIEYLTSNKAQIAWSTNKPSTGDVKFGTGFDMNQTATATSSGNTHRAVLNNLQPNTVYIFQAESGQGQSTKAKFKTPAAGQAAVKNRQLKNE